MARTFAVRLAVIAAVALLLRLLYVLIVMRGVGVGGDGLEFHLLANQLADGDGYIEPLIVAPGHLATADKPPLYPLALSVPSWLGVDDLAAHRVASCLMGAALVALVGLLGRRVAGERTGLLAAGIAAAYPLLIALDGSLRSESLYAPLIALALLCGYRLRDRPSAARAAALGAVIGLATLTRSEALALLALLAAPLLALLAPGTRLRASAVGLLACAAVLAPWVARNWVRFHRPLLSTNAGSLAYGANCHAAYYSNLIGTWACYPPLHATLAHNEADVATQLRRTGVDYAREHLARLPAVAGVRLLRSFDAWSPLAATRFEATIANRNLLIYRAGVAVYYLLLPSALAGALGAYVGGATLPTGRGTQGVAIDGKAQRGRHQYDPAGPPVQVLAAFCHEQGVVLASQPIEAGADKPEAELTVAPALLEAVDWHGRVLTGDALFCQRQLCQQVLDAGGDYLLLVKANQPRLFWAIELLFDPPWERPPLIDQRETRSIDQGHGRTAEVRHLITSTDLVGYLDWPGLAQVFRVERTWWEQGKQKRQVRYGITSLPPEIGTARHLLALKRGHWSIENRLHRSKDVNLGEDASLIHQGQGPVVCTVLRDAALSVLHRGGCSRIASRLRYHSRHPAEAVALLLWPGSTRA